MINLYRIYANTTINRQHAPAIVQQMNRYILTDYSPHAHAHYKPLLAVTECMRLFEFSYNDETILAGQFITLRHGNLHGKRIKSHHRTWCDVRETMAVWYRVRLDLHTTIIPADLTPSNLETFRRQLTVLSWQDTDKWNQLLKKGDALRIPNLLPGNTKRALLNNFYNSFK